MGLAAAGALSPGLLSSSPRPPQASALTTTGPPRASTCITDAGVAIGAGDDAQTVVNRHPPGTTYLVKAGIHLRNFNVRPKSGDMFCGEPGAVLDGGRRLRSAFSARPST